MKMDGGKQKLRFMEEELLFSTVLAKDKFVSKKKIESSNYLVLAESHW
jgi:hypothetical protein